MENLLLDFALEPPGLATLIEMVTEYDLRTVRLWLDIGVDVMSFHSDIGAQHGLMFSPRTFRKLLKHAYAEVFQACRRAGSHVYYSSDGWMLGLVDDLIECGVTLHDPEVPTNTAEGIARAYHGRLCAKAQLDAQRLPLWSTSDIHRHVREVVETISRPEGGLMVFCYVGQDVPLANIEALCACFQEFCG
jgi:uroporphyrinogen decarboxylase